MTAQWSHLKMEVLQCDKLSIWCFIHTYCHVTFVWAAPLWFLTHTLNGQNGCATYFARLCIRHHWHNGNGDITSKQNLTWTSKVVFITSILLLSRRKYLLFYWRPMISMCEILAYTVLSFSAQTKETEIRCAKKVNCSPLPTPFYVARIPIISLYEGPFPVLLSDPSGTEVAVSPSLSLLPQPAMFMEDFS